MHACARTAPNLQPKGSPTTMSTARPTLAASHRELTGKAVSRLRREGRLPAVVYGHEQPSTSITLDAHEFDQLRRHSGPNTLIDLSLDGKKAKPVLVHDVQVHRVTRRPIHVDLFLVKMTEELMVDVPLVPTGRSLAIDDHGGTLLQLVESVKVRALPDHLPQSIELPLDALVDFDATVKVSDLAIPSDVTLVTDPEETAAKVAPPRIEAEPLPLEAEEAEAGEGAEAEGGAEGETAEGESSED
jgi:large subunit ribosomal protein L25